MPTLYLILAHLLADFTLQPTKLIQWKKKNWQGIAVHCVIFWIITLIFLFPYLKFPQAWLILTLLAISHYILDKIKLTLHPQTNEKPAFFLMDQSLHIFFIFIVGYFLEKLQIISPDTYFFQKIYLNVRLVTYASMVIFLTYTYDLIIFLAKNKFNPKKRYRPNYTSFTKRLLTFFAIYLIFIWYRYLMLK